MSTSELSEILTQPVFSGTANVPFGALSLLQVQERAGELASAVGWGPTARVAGVARAWRRLAMEMERAGARRVAELDEELVLSLAPQLWVVPPGGSFL